MTLLPEFGVFVPTLEALPDATLVIDLDGCILWANPAFLLLTGRTLEETVGKPNAASAWPGTPQPFAEILHRVSSTNSPWKGETMWKELTGERLAGDHTISPIRNADHVTTSLLWMISARHRTLEALPEAVQRYPAILAAMAEGVVFQDLDGSIEACNESAERILGLSAEQIAGRVGTDPTWGAIYEDGTPFPADLHPAMVTLRTGQAQTSVVMGIHKPDSTVTWVSVNSRPLMTDRDHMSGVVTTFSDISECKAAMQRVEKLQKIVSKAQLSAGFGVFEWNAKPGESHWPPETSELYGLDPTTEPSFGAWKRTVHEDDLDRILLELEQALESPSGQLHVEYRTMDGNRWLSGQGLVYRETEGKPGHLVGVNVDITAKRKSEETLRMSDEAHVKSEEHYRLMFNSVSDAVFVFTLDGILLEANDSACIHLGYAREELLQKRFEDIAPKWAGGLPQLVDELRSKGSLLYEGIDLPKDGGGIPVEVMTRLVDLNGTPVLISCVRSVAARQQMLTALRSTEEKFARVFFSSPAVTTLSDLEAGDQIIEVNEAFERIMGYSREEAIGRTSAELGLWAYPAEFEVAAGIFKAEGRLRNFEYHFRKKSGEVGVGIISAEPIQIGERICPLASTIDISELKKTQHSLMTLATAIEQAEETVVITDRNGTIRYCNSAFERITGYSCEEAMGQNPRILQSGKHPKVFYAKMWETLNRGEVWSGRLTNKKKDGTLYQEEASISPLRDAAGGVSGFVAVKRDVSERLRLEEQFRQAQKLESVGRLAGGVAHDFNNLLTVINGYTSLLLTQIPEGDARRRYLTEIGKAGECAAGLTRQLLAFSRKQVIEPRVLDLNATLHDSAPMLQRLIGEDIRLQTDLAEDLGLVMADPDQIHQVIMNLAVNSHDAMPRGGTLDISTRNVERREQHAGERTGDMKPGPYVLLSVTDSGEGIEDSIRDQIFEPFFTTKGPAKGTGLGLATVYGIVRQSGGWIELWSEVGVGTTFSIWLPRIDGAAMDESPAAPQPEHGSEIILLVEDQDSVRNLTKTMLESYGYTVVTAASGADAILAATNYVGQIDLLISDVIMPGMSGKDLADRLTEVSPALRVLFMSGYTADVISHRGMLDAGVAFIGKPFTPEAIATKVRSLLGPDQK